MSIGAELGQNILQTHKSKNSEESMGVLNLLNTLKSYVPSLLLT